MITTPTKKILMGFAGLAAFAASAAAMAQEFKAPFEGQTIGYVIDARGWVVRDPYNLCWRDGYWTPAMAIAECDPDLVKKPEPKAEPKPVPKAEPVAPPPPVKLQPEKVTFSADILFDFDKAVLKPEGKTALDAFAGKLKGVKYEVILAVAHTDRIGSDAYNKKLSIRRAEAVKDYLVKEKGIEPNRVYTDGKGKADPMTKPDQCKGMGKENRQNKKLIACLQPDRRAEVEVAGTREAK